MPQAFDATSEQLTVRAATPEDDVAAVIRHAFGAGEESEGATVAAVWAEVAGSDAVRASLVAELGGTVVGHVGLSHAWLDARRALVDVWLLSPLAVLPERQGRGIGTRLVAEAVETARESGAPLLFVEGDPGYYAARGFQAGGDHGFVPASARTPAAAFRVVRFAGHEDWMTGQVVYRDAWWRHDAVGLRDPLLARLEEDR